MFGGWHIDLSRFSHAPFQGFECGLDPGVPGQWVWVVREIRGQTASGGRSCADRRVFVPARILDHTRWASTSDSTIGPLALARPR